MFPQHQSENIVLLYQSSRGGSYLKTYPCFAGLQPSFQILITLGYALSRYGVMFHYRCRLLGCNQAILVQGTEGYVLLRSPYHFIQGNTIMQDIRRTSEHFEKYGGQGP